MKNKVPKLRFPEFSGEWEEKELSSIIKNLKAGVSVNSEDIFIQNGEKGVLKTSCIFDGKFKLSENKKIIDSNIERANLNPQKGKIIISRMNTPELVGALAYIDDNYKNLFLPDRLWQTEFFNNEYDGKWLSYILNTPFYNQKIKDLATGTSNSMKNISKESFLKLKINITKEAEQEKIASFLSKVDESIEILEEEKELWEKYKKGMMQKIFNQELRFKDENGNDYPEWEEKQLGEIGNIITGSTPETSKMEYYGGEYLFISPIDINSNRYVKTTKTTLTKAGFLRGRKIPKMSICFVCIGSTIGKIAQNFEDCITNQQINSIVPFENISADFIYSLLEYNSNKIKLLAAEQAVPLINKTDFSKIKINFPSLPEQEKIANLLSTIDEKIELIEKELEGVKEFKKGLLQQMFI